MRSTSSYLILTPGEVGLTVYHFFVCVCLFCTFVEGNREDVVAAFVSANCVFLLLNQ